MTNFYRRWLQRVVSVAIRILDNNTAWLFSLNITLLLSFKFAPFYFIFIFILALRRDRLVAGWHSFYLVRSDWLPWIPLLAYPVIAYSYGGLPPTDDLLRHVTSWRHGYDYNLIYHNLREVIPHASMWILFEIVAGWLDRAFGFWGAVFTIQAVAYSCAAFLCVSLAKYALEDKPKSGSVVLLFVVSLIFMSGFFSRSTGARPEFFLTCWALSAFFVPARWWVFIGLLLMPAYWLSFVYIPAALLLRSGLRERFVSALLLAVVFFGFWYLYAGNEWLSNIISAYTYTIGRLVPPGESGSIVAWLLSPWIAPISLAFILFVGLDGVIKNKSIALLALWFLLPGQVRYIGMVGPLLIVLMIRSLPDIQLNASKSAMAFAVSIFIFFSVLPRGSGRLSELPSFKLPSSAVVLTQFSAMTYLLPAINPGVRISPAMEFGAVDLRVQKIILDMNNGVAPSCVDIKSLGYTHLVESSLHNFLPCLQLDGVSGGWRLWKVI